MRSITPRKPYNRFRKPPLHSPPLNDFGVSVSAPSVLGLSSPNCKSWRRHWGRG